MKRLNLPLYLLIMLLIYACNEPPEVLDKDISVAEVKEVFASLRGNSNGRQDTIGIDWDNARYKEISVGDALVFPLENVSGTYVSSEDNPVLYPLKNQGYAFAYKKEDESIALEYVQATPTADTEAFTGVVTVSDWNANAKYAFFYENGMLVTPESNSRTDGTVCTEIYTFNCTAVYAGGELQSASCTFAGTTTECTTTKEPSGIAPDDYEEPRGGSSDNSNLCPHPFILGAYVSCDLPCGGLDGYIENEAGACELNWEKWIEEKIDDMQKQMNCDEMTDSHNQTRKSQWDFYNEYQGVSLDEIIHERPDLSITGLGSQPGGPNTKYRYIEDPLNPNILIDMRHFLVMGRYGRAVGESVEVVQWLSQNESGLNDQDYYSNELGYAFYAEYGLALDFNPTALADFFITFINDRSKRNDTSNPDRCRKD